MQRTMVAVALGFLMAIGGGAALAAPGGQASSTATPSSQKADQQQSQAKTPGAVGFEEEEVATAPWTVQRINKQNHSLVLQAPDGTQRTMNIAAGTPGFDSLKKGDQIELDYFDASVFGTAPSATSSGHAAGNRKVRSIRKVGHDNKTDQSGTVTPSNSSGTSTKSPAQGRH